jgi:hypothetical protein
VRQVAPNKDMMCVNIHLFNKKKKEELLSMERTDDQDITVKRFKQNSSE